MFCIACMGRIEKFWIIGNIIFSQVSFKWLCWCVFGTLIISVVFFYYRKWSCCLVGCGCSMVGIGKVEEEENVDTSSANRVRRWKVWDRIQLIISLCENEVVVSDSTDSLVVFASIRYGLARRKSCVMYSALEIPLCQTRIELVKVSDLHLTSCKSTWFHRNW